MTLDGAGGAIAGKLEAPNSSDPLEPLEKPQLPPTEDKLSPPPKARPEAGGTAMALGLYGLADDRAEEFNTS